MCDTYPHPLVLFTNRKNHFLFFLSRSLSFSLFFLLFLSLSFCLFKTSPSFESLKHYILHSNVDQIKRDREREKERKEKTTTLCSEGSSAWTTNKSRRWEPGAVILIIYLVRSIFFVIDSWRFLVCKKCERERKKERERREGKFDFSDEVVLSERRKEKDFQIENTHIHVVHTCWFCSASVTCCFTCNDHRHHHPTITDQVVCNLREKDHILLRGRGKEEYVNLSLFPSFSFLHLQFFLSFLHLQFFSLSYLLLQFFSLSSSSFNFFCFSSWLLFAPFLPTLKIAHYRDRKKR